MKKQGLTYRDAGVDIDAGDALVRRIAPLARETHGPEVPAGLGGFGGLFDLSSLGLEQMGRPMLVSGTDGVGTKLLLAKELGLHDTIGIDCVAMCVNDVLTVGARPLFFLDYLATGVLQVDVLADVVAGIAVGCRQAGCALIGGETAEMPGVYRPGDYDVAGFVVGIVDGMAIVDGSRVEVDDVVLGLGSSGFHSNGYSLIRRVIDEAGLRLDEEMTDGRSLGEALLSPTLIYEPVVSTWLHEPDVDLRAMAHITGGGLVDNIPRALPEGLGVVLDRDGWEVPEVIQRICRAGPIPETEQFRTFNMGIGWVAVVPKRSVSRATLMADRAGFSARVIGRVTNQPGVAFV